MIAAALLKEMHEAHLVRAAEAAGRAFGRCCDSDEPWLLAPDPVPVVWGRIVAPEPRPEPLKHSAVRRRPASRAA
ncbi:hypothetical protein IMF23_19170 [Chelatococcus daeguensis]|uniref:Uncharacterized protein n=2 Tax=Chelatococcus TaxID=28209 RepID=A0AAC9JP95_9HYPH|nr:MULTISPECIES: hypothetical protein [Chelatococcus]APF37617.1 hypothetical protein BOQ54_09990 [Chelatococcus daeguensis]KZE35554.1 hypothetical protein AVW15_15085 [Chelatococcus daeguensis]MBM3085566.1 hypothetical protein [Chelatococcus daeguensis]CUA85931.1 hypothetical protein Ga0061061_102299 [Chelatococcus sambhunathii]